MKLRIASFLALVVSAIVFVASTSAKPAQTQAQAQPTQVQAAPAFTPTLVQPTSAPMATNTPQPTAIIPTIAPTSAPDVGLEITRVSIKATDQALSNQARRVKLELDAIEDSQWKSRLFYTGLFILFVGCVFLGMFMFGNASVKSWKDARKSQASQQNAPHDTGKAAEPPAYEWLANLPDKALETWLDMVAWDNGGKMPSEGKTVYEIFGGQSAYRDNFLANMKLARWAYKYPETQNGQWYVTRSFAKEAGREISWNKPQAENVHSV